ncbi:hypothetical protein [Parafrankia sp. FMc2]
MLDPTTPEQPPGGRPLALDLEELEPLEAPWSWNWDAFWAGFNAGLAAT